MARRSRCPSRASPVSRPRPRASARCSAARPGPPPPPLPPPAAGERRGRAYLRFAVADRPGVLAEITAAMRDAGVSIASMIQRAAGDAGEVLLVIVTHEAPERSVTDALDRLDGSPSLIGKPMLMHILDV